MSGRERPSKYLQLTIIGRIKRSKWRIPDGSGRMYPPQGNEQHCASGDGPKPGAVSAAGPNMRTLGDELISSEVVAVLERVKTTYDADATRVIVVV
jgi:hypothetical protein